MSATGPFLPDVGWAVGSFPARLKIYISVGLSLNSARPYSFDISIFSPDGSEITEDVQVIESRLVNTSISNRDDFTGVSITLFDNVGMQEAGLYNIRCRLYSGEAESTDKKEIDQYNSYFTLAENWLSNDMERSGK